jgi:predicted PurR-regulated permease PerM
MVEPPPGANLGTLRSGVGLVLPAGPSAILGVALVVFVLYVGADIFVPLALSILLSFTLAPPVVRLRRLGLPRIPAVILVTTFTASVLAGIGFLMTSQVIQLADNLPRYELNLREKIRSLRDTDMSGSVLDRTMATIKDIGQELQEATTPDRRQVARAMPGGEVEVAKPIPVEVQNEQSSPLQTILDFLGPVLGPVGTAGLVVVFTIFMLLQREDLRDRAIRLFGARDLTRTTQAMDEAARRVSRYLMMQLIINVCYGIPIGVGLWLIGVPNALLWGLLAAILRFIPYIGPVVAAVFPVILSIAVDPGWSMFFLTLGLIVSLELFSNNVLEPWLYGASTGLSPVAILMAALFWTSLWGPIGLLLATPLTVCLVVLGRHVPQLQFLDILLGDQPAMLPHMRVYQRLLAHDTREAAEIAEEFVDAEGLSTLGDEVIVPVLAQAELDRDRGALDRDMQIAIGTGIEEVAELLLEPDEDMGDQLERPVVLCIGQRSALDRAAAVAVGYLAENELPVEVVPVPLAASLVDLQRLRARKPAVVVTARVGRASSHHLERIVRRVRATLGAAVPVVSLHLGSDVTGAPPLPGAVTSMAEGLAAVRERLAPLVQRAHEQAGTEPAVALPSP